MATRRIPILGQASRPDTSGNVFRAPYSIYATNDVWDQFVWVFNDTSTRLVLFGEFFVPLNYQGSPKIIVDWTAIATSGDVEWDFDYRAVAVGESYDQSGTQQSVNNNDTAPGSVNVRGECELALTAANLVAGDRILFKLCRDGTDGGDTMAAAALLFAAEFQYSDA